MINDDCAINDGFMSIQVLGYSLAYLIGQWSHSKRINVSVSRHREGGSALIALPILSNRMLPGPETTTTLPTVCGADKYGSSLGDASRQNFETW